MFENRQFDDDGTAGVQRKTVLAVSIGLHVALALALLLLPARLFDLGEQDDPVEVVFFKRSALEPPVAPPPPPKPEPPPPEPPRPMPEPGPKPAPQRPEPRASEAPARPAPPPPRPQQRTPPRPAPQPVAPKPEPPKRKVTTDLFKPADGPAQRRQVAPKKVSTGAFVAAEPEPAPAPGPRHRGSARVGGFAVAAAEPEPQPHPQSRKTVKSGGFGDSVVVASKEVGKPKHGTVTDTAFDTNVSAARNTGSGRTGTVKQGGFGDGVTTAAATPKPRRQPKLNPDTPVEILSKPKPVYTAEARELKVEGEVVLEVTFVSSGTLRVLRVVNSLGHGLDEAAVEAARKIIFKPARRDGQPIDHTARLRIVFQLA